MNRPQVPGEKTGFADGIEHTTLLGGEVSDLAYVRSVQARGAQIVRDRVQGGEHGLTPRKETGTGDRAEVRAAHRVDAADDLAELSEEAPPEGTVVGAETFGGRRCGRSRNSALALIL